MMTRTFLQIGHADGSVSWINLAEATEIHRVSDELCQIRFAGGAEFTIQTREGVNAVIQAIREQVIKTEELPKLPPQSGRTT